MAVAEGGGGGGGGGRGGARGSRDLGGARAVWVAIPALGRGGRGEGKRQGGPAFGAGGAWVAGRIGPTRGGGRGTWGGASGACGAGGWRGRYRSGGGVGQGGPGGRVGFVGGRGDALVRRRWGRGDDPLGGSVLGRFLSGYRGWGGWMGGPWAVILSADGVPWGV